MFDHIKNFFREIRIDMDFSSYERQQRDEHEKQAKRRFSVEQLNIEKSKLLKNIESEANSKFNASIYEKEDKNRLYEKEAKEKEFLLSFFLRNYKEELDELYAKKDYQLSKKKSLYNDLSQIKESLSEAFNEKNTAFTELNDCKDSIDSWHAKSQRTPWLFGNAGKKIPKHSFFGQSHGDLDSYKYHRDSAYEDVQAAKNKIRDLNRISMKYIVH